MAIIFSIKRNWIASISNSERRINTKGKFFRYSYSVTYNSELQVKWTKYIAYNASDIEEEIKPLMNGEIIRQQCTLALKPDDRDENKYRTEASNRK